MLDADGPGTHLGALLPREFFARPALETAVDLLGCVLAHQTADGLVAVVLTEVEAYEGAADPASHAYRGRTGRNAVMFGPPGHAYVYFTYGMHFCVNLVCLPEGTASAVLLRAGRVIAGTSLATARRAASRNGAGPAGAGQDLARGPARLCQALGIARGQDGADVCDPASPLRMHRPAAAAAVAPGAPPAAAPGAPVAGHLVGRGPRVGVSSAGDRPWRFWVSGDPTVSPYRAHTPRPARRKPVSAADPSDGTMQL